MEYAAEYNDASCRFAAKSGDGGRWLPVRAHLLDTAGIMERLVLRWLPPSAARAVCGDPAELVRLCVFIAMVHDIGKLTPLFEAKILSQLPEIRNDICSMIVEIPEPGRFMDGRYSPHALAGEAILMHLGCPPGIAAVVGAHHGKPQRDARDLKSQMKKFDANYYGYLEDGENRALWEEAWRRCFELALDAAGYGGAGELPAIDVKSQVPLAGLLIMADWIASNTFYFPLIDCEETMEALSYPDRVERAWEKLNLPAPWSPCCFYMDGEEFAERFSFEPNAVQSAVTEAAEEAVSPGIFILEAQMGAGKTEAALGAAEILASKTGCGGLFFGLPTQATANGIFGRLLAWAEGQSEGVSLGIRLAHGMAELNDDYRALFRGRATTEEDEGGITAHPWFDGRKQALLADFVIGTVDQLLMAALKQKHVMLRHLGLAGKVVVIDECHAYDAYMGRYLDRALNWLGAYQIPVVLLSATLPSKRRAEFVEAYLNRKRRKNKDAADDEWRQSEAYPLLTWTDGGEVRQRAVKCEGKSRAVRIIRKGEDEWIDELGAVLARGGCAGVIVNTVKRAQQTARAVRERLPGKEVILAHSRFTAADRIEREAHITARLGKRGTEAERDGLIVVGTQVLEQSLDIDFDILVSDLCPMDLLLQRIGRLHRHDRRRPAGLEEAECWVLCACENELDAGGKAVYGGYLLLRTAELLPSSVTLPDDISPLVQKTYIDMPDGAFETDELAREWKAYKEKAKRKERDADAFKVPPPQRGVDGTIHGWLSDDLGDGDSVAAATVRDGKPSIEVLLMVRDSGGDFSFMPWQHEGLKIPGGRAPSEEECRMIARQKISLPNIFHSRSDKDKDKRNDVISFLESENRRLLPEWQRSGLLRGELVLPLDENLRASLCGYTLSYSREEGLTIMKVGDESDGSGI